MNVRPIAGIALSLVLIASTSSAQSISVGLRGTGSIPTGSFAEEQSTGSATLIEGAKNGFGYGLDVGLGLGMFGLYGGFDQIKFDCEAASCQQDGEYTLQGVTAGVKLMPPLLSRFRPFVKGGVTFNNLKGGYGGSSSNRLSTDKTPGYEIGIGGDYSLLGLISVTPQVRYVGQNLKARVPGVTTPTTATEQGVSYFTFDLGLTVRTPFAR
jgi:opacity protein-like surface antigen